MPFEFKLDKVNKLGDFDDTYGQAYWCASVDSDLPLKFNSQNQDIMAGDTITAETTENARSTKGVDYLKLKKIQVVASIQEKPIPMSLPVAEGVSMHFSPEIKAQWDRLEANQQEILSKLDKLLGDF